MSKATEAATQFHWYALRVPPQKEFVAREILKRKGVATFLPVERVWRRRNKYTKEKELRQFPLMPRYVFTGFPKRIPIWFDVFALPVITGVVGVNGDPQVLDEIGMARIMKLYENAIDAPKFEKHMATHKEFAIDDSVQILGGPFDGLIVPVVSLFGAHAKVLISLFGGDMPVEIPIERLVAA